MKRIEKFISVRNKVVNVAAIFPPEKREIKLFDQWNLGDVLAHLSGWDFVTAETLRSLKSGTTIDKWIEDTDKFNEMNVVASRGKPWQEIYENFVESSEQLISEYSTIPPEMYRKNISSEIKVSPRTSLHIDIKHYEEHLKLIKARL